MKGTFLVQEGAHSYHQRLGIWRQEIHTNLVKLTHAFLVTLSLFTTQSPNPFVLSILHKLICFFV